MVTVVAKSLSSAVVVVVVIVWAVNFFAQFVIVGYHPDPAINGIFGTGIVSALLPKLFVSHGERSDPGDPTASD